MSDAPKLPKGLPVESFDPGDLVYTAKDMEDFRAAGERAARAAAFREAAEVCDALWSSDDAEYHYIPDARGALITAMEALRARAEGDGEGGR